MNEPFNLGKHITTALESFPDEMTKKQLINECAKYIEANPVIYITPAWFAELMMDDCVMLAKRKNRIKGSKAFLWINVHKLDHRYKGRHVVR
jgi:GH35 family endo-1,4-beta-xylanase